MEAVARPRTLSPPVEPYISADEFSGHVQLAQIRRLPN